MNTKFNRFYTFFQCNIRSSPFFSFNGCEHYTGHVKTCQPVADHLDQIEKITWDRYYLINFGIHWNIKFGKAKLEISYTICMISPISQVDKSTLLTNLFQFLWYIWDNTPEPNQACYDWRKIRPSQTSSSCPFQPLYLLHHGLKENRVFNSIEKNS